MRSMLVSLALVPLASCAFDDPEPVTAPRTGAVALRSPGEKLIHRPDAIANRYIVVLNPPAKRAPADIAAAVAATTDRLAASHGAEVTARYATALQGFAAAMSPADALVLAGDPEVAYVEEDAMVHVTSTQSDAIWNLDRVDQRSLPLDGRYRYLNPATEATVYVIDTGIRATHSDIAGRVLAGFSSIPDGRGTVDCHGHGTHVSGTAAGSTVGVAKDASVVPVRVLDCQGSGPTSGVIAGIDWVAANHISPAVANMSLGAPPSDAEDAAVRNLIAAGVTVVVAAGNENENACLSTPSRVTEAITVAASNDRDARADFSNFGSCVDIFAPGVDIFSAWFDGDQSAAVASGTSQAAPHVAGATAMYLAANPTATPAMVAQALIQRATPGKISDTKGSPNLILNTNFVDTRPPVAAITSPPDGATVLADFTVTADISDISLERAQLSVDGQFGDSLSAPPFSFLVSRLAPGAHTIVLTATDAAGQTTNSMIHVTVSPTGGPSGGPTDPGGDDPGTASAGGCSTAGGPAPLAVLVALLGLRRRRRTDSPRAAAR